MPKLSLAQEKALYNIQRHPGFGAHALESSLSTLRALQRKGWVLRSHPSWQSMIDPQGDRFSRWYLTDAWEDFVRGMVPNDA